MIQIDTKNILFIVGGALYGIEDIVKQRLGEKIIGFGQNNKAIDDDSSYMQEIVAEDIQKIRSYPWVYRTFASPCGPWTVNGWRLGSYLDRA